MVGKSKRKAVFLKNNTLLGISVKVKSLLFFHF